MSMIGEGAKVATSTIDALKSQPLAIALIVINVLFLAVAIWMFSAVAAAISAEREHRNQLTSALLNACGTKIIDEVEQGRMEIQGGFDQILKELRDLRLKQ